MTGLTGRSGEEARGFQVIDVVQSQVVEPVLGIGESLSSTSALFLGLSEGQPPW